VNAAKYLNTINWQSIVGCSESIRATDASVPPNGGLVQVGNKHTGGTCEWRVGERKKGRSTYTSDAWVGRSCFRSSFFGSDGTNQVGVSRADTQKSSIFRRSVVITIPSGLNGVQGVVGSNPTVPTR
jgi:hypothetical protein